MNSSTYSKEKLGKKNITIYTDYWADGRSEEQLLVNQKSA